MKLEKRTIMILMALLVFFGGVQKGEAKKSEEAETASIALIDFLENVSEEHKVFFTYNPTTLKGLELNPEEYQFTRFKPNYSPLGKSYQTRF